MATPGSLQFARVVPAIAAPALACAFVLAAACSSESGSGADAGRDGGRRADGAAGGSDSAVATPFQRCIAACEEATPGAVTTLEAIFDCSLEKCPTECDPELPTADAGAGTADGGGVCPRVGRGPGLFSMLTTPACDACVAARCCDKVNACLDDTNCAKLNACEDRCVVDHP